MRLWRNPISNPSAEETLLMAEGDRFLVPSRHPRIVAYFLAYLFVAHNLRERVARLVLRRLGTRLLFSRGWPLRLGASAEPLLESGPVQTQLSGVGQRHRWRSVMEAVSIALAREEGNLLRGTPLEGRPIRWILLRDYPEDWERLVLFLFSKGDGQPGAVLKLRRGLRPGSALKRECEALRLLAERLPSSLRLSVPSPLAYRSLDGTEALLLRFLPGRSAYVEMHTSLAPRLRVATHFRAASAWLADFHSATRSPERHFAPEHESPGLREILSSTEADGEATVLSWYEELRERCAQSPLALVFSHGDFWARNLLLGAKEKDSAGVVDWEHFSQEAPPFEDLFQFPLTYGLNYPWSRYRRRPPEEAFRLTFIEENAISREVRLYFGDYCGKTGLEPDLLRPLFHLYLLTRFPRGQGRGGAGNGDLWLRFHRILARAGRSVFSG